MHHTELTRRSFFAGSSLACLAAATPAAARLHGEGDEPADSLPANFPSQDVDSIRSVVGASHGNFDVVKEMVSARPALAKAAYDWGFGDWESALGAASHVGRPDIARFLIEHGARPNLFTFAMLGQLDVVRATVEANPGVERIPGPHGITLLAHARFGGEDAAEVYDYLSQLDGANITQVNKALSDDDKQVILGDYEFADAQASTCSVITMRNGTPGIKVGDGFARTLLHQGDFEFHPGGAPAVRIAFRVADRRATALSIHDGPLIATARRIG